MCVGDGRFSTDLGVMLLLLLRSSGNQQIKIFGTTMCRERSES